MERLMNSRFGMRRGRFLGIVTLMGLIAALGVRVARG
jgi:hypothetical protein